MVRLDLFRAHTCGPRFHRSFLETETVRQIIQRKFWPALQRVP